MGQSATSGLHGESFTVSHLHQSSTPVPHTSPPHQSLTPVPHTSPSHQSLTLVLHTSPSHQSLTPVPHTSPPHQSSTLSQSPVPAKMTPVLALLLTVLSLSQAQGPTEDLPDLGPPDHEDAPDVVDWEMQAFEKCESDDEEGLTWNEVEACEDKFGTLLEAKGIALPSQTDFEASDLNNDGTLMFEEWMEWVNLP